VFQHSDTTKMIDSPSIFCENDVWYITDIVLDVQGYGNLDLLSQQDAAWFAKAQSMFYPFQEKNNIRLIGEIQGDKD